jgi:hypothetical protein
LRDAASTTPTLRDRRHVELGGQLGKDDDVSPAKGTQQLIAETEQAIGSLPSGLGNAGWLELGGLALLGVGSCFAAVEMFLAEILALFGLR